MNEIDLNGFNLLERFKFKIKKNTLKFREINVFLNKNVVVKNNIVFNGKHKGEIRVEPDSYFIHRGELIGKLIICKKSKVYIFGKIDGEIEAEELLNLKSGCDIKGVIKCEKVSIEEGVKINVPK